MSINEIDYISDYEKESKVGALAYGSHQQCQPVTEQLGPNGAFSENSDSR